MDLSTYTYEIRAYRLSLSSHWQAYVCYPSPPHRSPPRDVSLYRKHALHTVVFLPFLLHRPRFPFCKLRLHRVRHVAVLQSL